MSQSQIFLASAALLIAAIIMPIPKGLRALLFFLLGGYMLLSGFGSGLNDISGWFSRY